MPDRPRILVVGDVMLDHTIFGCADRISPEAPVPVMLWESEEWRLGGAAGVAAMCRALGAEVDLCSVAGYDDQEDRLAVLLHEAGIKPEPLLVYDPCRTTTVKTRIVARTYGRPPQHHSRIDRESVKPIDAARVAFLSKALRDRAPWDQILVSDYGKGVCAPELIGALTALGPAIIDPPSGNWRQRYAGRAGCFVPNRIAAGLPESIEAARQRAAEARESLTAEAVVLKLDTDGCVLATREGTLAIPTEARNVVDVCGAGDQFLAGLGVWRAMGHCWIDACRFANAIAGQQVERFGCVPVTLAEIRETRQESAA